MRDTCVFVDVCGDSRKSMNESDNTDLLCDCTASYGGEICSTCEICPGGSAISVDCTNVNAEAVTQQCQVVDLQVDGLVSGNGTAAIAGFAPNFSGFCSELENALDNRIACDCSDAVGGSFSVSCRTLESVCAPNHGCGVVESTLAISDGRKDGLTSCVHHEAAPFEGTLSCTSLQLEKEDSSKIHSCWAMVNGTICESCHVCSAGRGVTLDCANVNSAAVVSECQEVNLTSSYEFIPNFKYEVPESPSSSAASTSSLGIALIVLILHCFWGDQP